jgi:MFS family permease
VFQSRAVERTLWPAVVAVGIAVLMAALDMTIVAIALPAIGWEFGAPPERAQWVILAYTLPMIALMIPAGRWIEPVNRRRALAIAVAGFAVASALAGAAPSLALLLAARAAQGVFGAVLSVSVLAVAAAVVHPSQRGQAMGVMATLGPLGSVTGPGLGGLLVAGPGWRWIFFVNLPICLLAVALAVRSVPSRGGLQGLSAGFVAESVTAGGAALALLLAMRQGTVAGWGSPQAVALAAIALVAGCAWTLLPTSRPTVRALGRPALTGQLVVLLAGAASTGAGYFLAAFFLQGPLRLPSSQAGAVLLALPLSLAAAAQLGGRAADRFGTKLPAALGAGLILAGGLLLLPLSTAWGPLDFALRFAMIGLGSGLLAGPNQAAIMAATPRSLMGTAGGLSGLARTLGFALGPALAAVLWSDGELTADAMRPAFALMVVLPALVMATVLVAPTIPLRSVAPTPGARRPEEDVVAAPAAPGGWH